MSAHRNRIENIIPSLEKQSVGKLMEFSIVCLASVHNVAENVCSWMEISLKWKRKT